MSNRAKRQQPRQSEYDQQTGSHHRHAGQEHTPAIFEQLAHPGRQRDALLGIEPRNDVRLKAREHRTPRDTVGLVVGLQRLAHRHQVIGFNGASGAVLEMIGNRNALANGQFFVVERRELAAHVRTAHGQHRKSPNSSRSA